MRLEAFLFCEQIRQEANGAATFIGVLPGASITLREPLPSGATVNLPALTCALLLDRMEGVTRFEYQCEVIKDGKVIQRTPRENATRLGPGPTHMLYLTFQPFFFPGTGDYTFKVTIQPAGNTPTSFSRRFRILPALGSPSSGVTLQ